jgi:6,7-dimethyl-8-ribityllumazine synthase
MHKSDSAQAFPKVDPQWKVGIVAASFYKEETEAMITSAKTCFTEAGIPAANVSVHPAAGSFEIPLVGEWLASAKKVDALIGLGIIVQGETKHADLLAQESARGLMDVQLKHSIPFAFEILWVSDLAHARARGDKGREAAMAVLHSLAEKARINA